MPATEGYENAPGVLFQGHMDMVCVKDEGVVHDFSKDALDLYLYRDADYGVTLAARGTSLGADNGVGLAMMLTLMTTPGAAASAAGIPVHRGGRERTMGSQKV